MKVRTGDVLLWGAVAVAGLVATRLLTGWSPDFLDIIFDPEAYRLRKELEEETKKKNDYWNAYLETVDLGIDRIGAIASALDPLAPNYLLNYPFLPMSFAQMESPSAFPGLPTPREWQEMLNQKLHEWSVKYGTGLAQEWAQPTAWPNPL